MENNNTIKCGGFYFIHNFDSGNLGHVERVPTELIAPCSNHKTNTIETPDYEFNIWTRPDCAGTEFENGNRTWFYFGVQASEPSILVRLNLINLNKQGKMYNQGMAPVTRTLPGKPQWERIKDRPVHTTDDNMFTLSFKYRTSDNLKATTFFAFTYPYSFVELQIALNSIDLKMLPLLSPATLDDIYYCRECLIYSLEGRRVDLLTISSYHGITTVREERLKNLFPENQERPYKFQNKKVIFMSARVHPGETPSSFVFNGFLNLLLNKNDPIAIQLRKLYVFKMIPFLNPDGVARGHYRTDTRGVNLNRVYLNPSLMYHPTVYASRALIRYHHFGCEKEDVCEDTKSLASRSIQNISESTEIIDQKKKKTTSIFKDNEGIKHDEKKNYAGLRSLSTNKSTNTIKAPSEEYSRLSGETANLVDQVCDLRLQDMTSQTNTGWDDETAGTPEDNTSLLSDATLRNCLGTLVHVSTSEELSLQGTNPLRPLRDTLKNSISLLMESSSSAGETRPKGEWCQQCKLAVDSLERTNPGIERTVPGYGTPQESETSGLGSNIMVYSCKNCFKRYMPAEGIEECTHECERVRESGSKTSVSAAEGGNTPPRYPPSTEGIMPAFSKEDKPKLSVKQTKKKTQAPLPSSIGRNAQKDNESGLYLYIDLHGHASKKGIFMYGNYFEDVDSSVECMMLPRIMALNNLHFHFSSCNFTERNMYLKDRRDGMSREGSGRVAVLKATGLVRSYTLECNYNTGRLVNVLPPPLRDNGPGAHGSPTPTPTPPKYTPHIYEEVGRSLGASILDLTGQHPNSRVPSSEHRTLASMRDWLRSHMRSMHAVRPPQLMTSRLRPKTSSPTRATPYARSKGKVTEERKENTYAGAKSDSERRPAAYPAALAPRPPHDHNPAAKYGKRTEPAKGTSSRARHAPPPPPPAAHPHPADECKPKPPSGKRRSVLAVRKPNASRPRASSQPIAAPAGTRRAAEDGDNPRASLVVHGKVGKRSFSRPLRRESAPRHLHAVASSSSSEGGAVSAACGGSGWEEVAGGTALAHDNPIHHSAALPPPAKRRSFPNPSPARLKKIRLKSGI